MIDPLPPLCIDCRFHHHLFYGDHYCKRWPEETREERSPVNGNVSKFERKEHCLTQRLRPDAFPPSDRCGPEGRYFQAIKRPPLPGHPA